jgi:hypothetical protein
MTPTAIFWSMIAHVALVYGVYIMMYRRRREAVKAGNVRVSQFGENQNEPAESLFVLSRYVHAYIHVTSNGIRHRQPAFTAGLVAVALLWLWLAVNLLGAG